MMFTTLLDSNLDSTQAAFRANLSPEVAQKLEEVMQCDRDFFLQNPECDYYVRPITSIEILEGQVLGKAIDETARVLVGEVCPGSRIRLTILDNLPPPVEEFRAIQQQLRQQIESESRTHKKRIKKNQILHPKPKGFG